MLVQPTRRQHLPQQAHTPTIPSPSSSLQNDYQPLPQHFATQHSFDKEILDNYIAQQQSLAAPYMTTAYGDFASPAIRIQQSTPTPQLPQSGFSHPSMLSASNGSGLDNWNYNAQQSLQKPHRGHQRASSSSSAGSGGSHYQAVGPSASYQTFPNHLPTPTHTPTQESFMSDNNLHFTPTHSNLDQPMAAHTSMQLALMDQSDELPGFAHSARQSVSSYGPDSPATPHTAQEDMDFKTPATDMRQFTVPKLERTFTDMAADTLYDPTAVATQSIPQTKPAQSSLLSPYRNNNNENVQRALQAAQYARSQSPASLASRGDSPFRKSSPYRQTSNSFGSPMVTTAAMARDQTHTADAAYAMKSRMQSNQESEPKTISPKDALLDYRDDEDSKVPLFPDDGQYGGGDQYRSATQSNFDSSSQQSYRRDDWATPQFSPNFPATTAPSLQPATSYAFATPSVQSNMHSIPLSSTSQYRSASNMSSAMDQTPEFPAHLTSMESSASEAEPPNGSQGSERYMHKPANSNADAGTYSCTYHGCSQRFETPQKLQKHKREGHRNTSVAASMTSAAILERNSQAGPHKCERVNPTTGKPCNTVFSRPYDLTRHEDTIHNGRKQKVRCALCAEEKTFSRNDALTRHMRVVHPEVDFPGKHRKRGGNHD